MLLSSVWDSMKLQYNESSKHMDTPLLRRYALILLEQCPGGSANLLREHLRLAKTNADVMRLRGALFECMTMHLGEAEAMERIRSLDGCA